MFLDRLLRVSYLNKSIFHACGRRHAYMSHARTHGRRAMKDARTGLRAACPIGSSPGDDGHVACACQTRTERAFGFRLAIIHAHA